MPRPSASRLLLAACAALAGVALAAYWAAVVRGAPLVHPTLAGTLTLSAPAPALDGQTFAQSGFPTLVLRQREPGVFEISASRVEVRRRVVLRPFSVKDEPKVPARNLQAALDAWARGLDPAASVQRVQLPPVYP